MTSEYIKAKVHLHTHDTQIRYLLRKVKELEEVIEKLEDKCSLLANGQDL